MRRYDVYGFRGPSLEDAATFVHNVLGIQLRERDSYYRGLYYTANVRAPQDYLLETNTKESRWHSYYPEYGATLMISDVPDMDAIREKLTSGAHGPDFLHSIVHASEPPDEYPPKDGEDDDPAVH